MYFLSDECKNNVNTNCDANQQTNETVIHRPWHTLAVQDEHPYKSFFEIDRVENALEFDCV